MPTRPNPQPGDVLFVYSAGKESWISGWLQRTVFESANPSGPWFSHVAIALSDQIALEASTAPAKDDPPTWSGVELEGGVRIILLPDLLIPSKNRAILRHSSASAVDRARCDIASRAIAGLYGSSYSVDALKRSAEAAVPLIAQIVPKGKFDWSASADQMAQELGRDPAFRERILAKLGDDSFASVTSSFFCSQLVEKMLVHLGLAGSTAGRTNITPCSLYDRLLSEGWADVTETDYGDEAIGDWWPPNKDGWAARYYERLGVIQYWRSAYPTDAALDILGDEFHHANRTLDDIQKRLARLFC